jgi:hypothetical protein
MFLWVTVPAPVSAVSRCLNLDMVVWFREFEGTYLVQTEVDQFPIDKESYQRLITAAGKI